MRRRIVFLALMISGLAAALVLAQFTPKTATMDTLALTGTPLTTTAEFKPVTATVDMLALTGTPAATTTEFKPQTVPMDTLALTGTGATP
jgi:hypothetical protein